MRSAILFLAAFVGGVMPGLASYLRSLRRRPAPRDVQKVPYGVADRLIREGTWKLAVPEEDANSDLGWAYIERVR